MPTRIEYVSITKIHLYSGTYSIRKNILQNWSRLGRNRYGTNQYSQSNIHRNVFYYSNYSVSKSKSTFPVQTFWLIATNAVYSLIAVYNLI